MKREDLDAVWVYANSLWNTFSLPDTDQKYDIMSELWYDLLKDYPLQIIKAGMLELAKESDFCNVAKIANHCKTFYKLSKNEIQDEDTICNEIRKAIRNSAYHAKEEFDKLSPIAQRIVGTPNFLYECSQMDSTTVGSVIMSNIKKSAKAQLEKADKLEIIENNDLKRIVSDLAQKKSLEYDGEDFDE